MDYNEFVKDFIDRTQSNLGIIDGLHDINDKRAYETTQLINSLFGLLIVPQQFY